MKYVAQKIWLYPKVFLFLQKLSGMDEKIEALSHYNFWGDRQIELGFQRIFYTSKISQFVGNRLVKVVCGQRRAGKSYILRQLAAWLINEKHVNPKNTFFLNKDILAFDFVSDYKALDTLFLNYLETLSPAGRVYIFIDEVQNIDGWEKFVNSYSQDYSREYEIFVTGSNSKMLSGELATVLSGRYVTFEVLPYSFDEYAESQNLSKDRATFIKYINDGGLPEMLNLNGQEVRRNYVMSLKDTILLRDIITRYRIKDPALLQELFVYLVNNTSSLFSVNSLVKYYKSRGANIGYDKVSQYVGYMCDAYLIHRAERYDIRGRETLAGVCKYYVNDMAFHNYLFRGVAHGLGYDLENVVYLELRRMGYDVYVGALQGKEVDFVARKDDRLLYVQVAYMLIDDDTIKREYAPLLSIRDSYEKIVVSLDDIVRHSMEGIRNVSAWELRKIL